MNKRIDVAALLAMVGTLYPPPLFAVRAARGRLVLPIDDLRYAKLRSGEIAERSLLRICAPSPSASAANRLGCGRHRGRGASGRGPPRPCRRRCRRRGRGSARRTADPRLRWFGSLGEAFFSLFGFAARERENRKGLRPILFNPCSAPAAPAQTGHPSKGTEKDRILGFNLETGTADRLTIQTVARLRS